jgi:glyoxylase-like metal-dependent hydrolase (beta-lactamase superfamily II)
LKRHIGIENAEFGSMHDEISDGVFLIDTLAAGTPGLVAGYLIKGERSALVDAGYPSSADSVLSELRSIDGTGPNVDCLIPTHVHLDHAGAIGSLSIAMPKARVLVNKHGLKHLMDPSKVVSTAASLFGEKAMALYGTPRPLPRERLEAVESQQELDLGAGKELRIFYTPGHAWHHLSVFLEKERLLITGDAAGVRYSGFDIPIPATPPPGFDEEQYVKSLTEFMNMDPAGLLLPHFGSLRKHIRAFLETNIETIRQWGSIAAETLKAGEPVDRLFEAFMTDVMNRSGLARHEIPDQVERSIKLSAMGCYTYAQEKMIKQ